PSGSNGPGRRRRSAVPFRYRPWQAGRRRGTRRPASRGSGPGSCTARTIRPRSRPAPAPPATSAGPRPRSRRWWRRRRAWRCRRTWRAPLRGGQGWRRGSGIPSQCQKYLTSRSGNVNSILHKVIRSGHMHTRSWQVAALAAIALPALWLLLAGPDRLLGIEGDHVGMVLLVTAAWTSLLALSKLPRGEDEATIAPAEWRAWSGTGFMGVAVAYFVGNVEMLAGGPADRAARAMATNLVLL